MTDTPHTRAVAVLPIRNLGGPRDAYIADTLTEELTERLIVCPGVRVASRLALRLEEPGDLLEIGRRAGVDVMVEGSMFRQPSGLVRARLRMVEMEQGFVLWSESFERRASEIYELHADIAHAVARTLTVQLRRSRNVPQPENRESVDIFLRAKRAYAAGGVDSVHVALELLDEALRIGPSDPLLLSYKALALLRCWVLDTHGFSASVSEAHAIARRVLETNPNQGEAHLALGIDAYLNANWVVAARRLEESVRCNPALSDAHYYLGLLRCSASHADTGLRMLDVAQRLDPKNLEAIWAYAITLALIGQVSRALDQLDRADFVHEDHPGTITARLRIATWQGDRQSVARAREAVSRCDPSDSSLDAIILHLFIDMEPDRPVGALTAFAASADSPSALRGRVMQVVAERMALSGYVDEAWSALRAAAPHSIDALWFNRCPALSRMTRMPAFLTLRSQVAHRASLVFGSTSVPTKTSS